MKQWSILYKAALYVLLFQSISAQDENLSKTMFLPLAERMVEKMVKEEKIEAEAEVRYIFLKKLIVDVINSASAITELLQLAFE